jgi:hypothetical protein
MLSDDLSEINDKLKKSYTWYCTPAPYGADFDYALDTKSKVRRIITDIENLRIVMDTPPGVEPQLLEQWLHESELEFPCGCELYNRVCPECCDHHANTAPDYCGNCGANF